VRALLTLSRRLAIEKRSAGSCWLQRGGHSRCMSLSVWRHVATRYDKLAANGLAFVQFASIRPWLRADESAP